MNDLGALQELINKANEGINANYNLTITLVCFVIVNLLATGLDIFFQFRLKNKEKSITKHSLRESKRIDAQELLYTMIEELTYYDGSNSSDFQNKVSIINKYLTHKKLYLNKEIITITQDFNDYFLAVLNDYTNKNYATEMSFLEEYYNIFNND